MYRKLTCIAQARVIAGRKTAPHICSIVLDRDTSTLLRVCLPFDSKENMPIRRWSTFEAVLEKQSRDTRQESFFIDDKKHNVLNCAKGQATASIHRELLNLAVPEEQLIEEKRTIGVKKLKSLVLHFESLDAKAKQIEENMEEYYDLVFAEKIIRVSGEDALTGKKYGRQLLDWNLYETMRINRCNNIKQTTKEIKETINRYKHPYFITGTTRRRRKSFMAISVLSSPFSYG